jgi:hypothetical protein
MALQPALIEPMLNHLPADFAIPEGVNDGTAPPRIVGPSNDRHMLWLVREFNGQNIAGLSLLPFWYPGAVLMEQRAQLRAILLPLVIRDIVARPQDAQPNRRDDQQPNAINSLLCPALMLPADAKEFARSAYISIARRDWFDINPFHGLFHSLWH